MADIDLEELPPEEGPNRAFLLGALVLGGLFVALLFAIGLYLALSGPARGRPAAPAVTPTRTPIPSPSPLPPTYTPTPSPTPIPTATPTPPVVVAGQPTATPTPGITATPIRPTPTPRPGGLPQTGGSSLGWGLGAVGVLLLAFLARRLRSRPRAS
ncbi:hypothetical protein [Thermoflexus sp.]|uniref:hypothetical protein n=1 Tax=Thermoflexus sp. TaxID=1969742 RepID=UPI0025D7F654|nr:hypothetical protein [Thermoflexus sp.]MDW8179950.1 hypothetical protein [Anaerolineae bacterium]MCS6963921.1 hypothetical protein [Thermoflexus sp.]MCS7350499.1 hypothetical protein [Thermoflexus sp.]MCX7690328.1 hypothetical protein [Thermoflexus sp.]MDW8184446.1 hypothetical protein [Anaerolineae bacterium]